VVDPPEVGKVEVAWDRVVESQVGVEEGEGVGAGKQELHRQIVQHQRQQTRVDMSVYEWCSNTIHTT
jgi:hypothetical protein